MAQMHIVTPDKVSNKSWKRVEDFAFASQRNMIPVVAGEVAKLALNLPLGFIKVDDRFVMVAITALQAGVNYFVLPDGRWFGDYVPAELACHPFKMLQPQNHPTKVLCVDMQSDRIGEKGEGEEFFGADGKPSPALQEVTQMLSQVDRNREATQVAIEALAAAGLIKPWELTIEIEKEDIPVLGIYCLDEVALNNLPDSDFLALRSSKALPVAYSQLISMSQLNKLQQAMEMHDNWNTPQQTSN